MGQRGLFCIDERYAKVCGHLLKNYCRINIVRYKSAKLSRNTNNMQLCNRIYYSKVL